jgi:hypothetical protein
LHALVEASNHGRRDIYGQDLGAEASGGNTEGAGTRGDVQEAHARTQANPTQSLFCKIEVRGRYELVITGGKLIPGGAGLLWGSHGFLLSLRLIRPILYSIGNKKWGVKPGRGQGWVSFYGRQRKHWITKERKIRKA